MPDHTKAEKAKNKKSGIGNMLRRLLPGQLAKDAMGDAQRKIDKATKKKKRQ